MYHITITDKKKGSVVLDTDTRVIIGAIHLGDGAVRAMSLVEANAFDSAITVDALGRTRKSFLLDNPTAAAAYMTLKALGHAPEESEVNG